MATSTTAAKLATFKFPYITCRNISAPEDEVAGRKIYSGHAPASSVLELEDDENVREYLVEARGKAKARPTLVHQAIRKTLEDQPDQFSILNGGMALVARAADVDDKNRVLTLRQPSIINGSQTQGELRRYFDRHLGFDDFFEPSIKYELIVTNDDNLIAEISISRNFQNDVRAISIAGRRGQLDELELAVRKVIPSAKLRKSETDLVADGEFLDTEKLIQVIFALMPGKLLTEFDLETDPSKVFTYSQKTRCLKLFQRFVDERQGNKSYDAAYHYFLDVAGLAWKLYERWKSHQGFYGTRLRAIERENGQIIDVPDGIIFPILAALSAFVVQNKQGAWTYQVPQRFDEKELIDAAAQAYTEIASHNPQTMGKSKACYSTLLRLTTIFARLG
jgi:AIPR protein